jgi:hypothetical protein
MPRYAIVEAPSALGHVPEDLGVERAPEVLLGAGFWLGLSQRVSQVRGDTGRVLPRKIGWRTAKIGDRPSPAPSPSSQGA